MLGLLEAGRPLVGLMAVAVAQAALDDSIEYARNRKQHGKYIAEHQLIQAMIAEMATEIDAARLLCYRALDQVEKGTSTGIESSKAKLFATDMALRVVNKAMEIHGGQRPDDGVPRGETLPPGAYLPHHRRDSGNAEIDNRQGFTGCFSFLKYSDRGQI